MPGSGIMFVTVTVAMAPNNPGRTQLIGTAGRLLETYRGDERRTGAV